MSGYTGLVGADVGYGIIYKLPGYPVVGKFLTTDLYGNMSWDVPAVVLAIASTTVLGGVKIGSGIVEADDGTISVTPSSIGAIATSTINGTGVLVDVQNGAITGTHANTGTGTGTSTGTGSYTLPIASGSILGGVKIGSGVSEAGDGTISVTPGSIGALAANGATSSGWVNNVTVALGKVTAVANTSYLIQNAVSGLRGLVDVTGGEVTGFHPLTSGDVTGALGYTPGSSTGNISGSGSVGGLAYFTGPSTIASTVGLNATPGPSSVPVSDGSGTLNSWVTHASSDQKKVRFYSASAVADVTVTDNTRGHGAWMGLAQIFITAGSSGSTVVVQAIGTGTSNANTICALRVVKGTTGADMGGGYSMFSTTGTRWFHMSVLSTFTMSASVSMSLYFDLGSYSTDGYTCTVEAASWGGPEQNAKIIVTVYDN
jgi:hypothetical protein